MDPKLTLLFLLIGAIIGLSHLNYEDVAQLKRKRNGQRWLGVVPRWRKS
jgi:hypothetical protein